MTAGTAVCEAADISRDAPAVFSDEFRTLTAAIDGNRLAPPVLTLGSDDRLTIGFDGMGDERRYLRYSICLCDADWSPSELIDSEVFDGFNYAATICCGSIRKRIPTISCYSSLSWCRKNRSR